MIETFIVLAAIGIVANLIGIGYVVFKMITTL